MIESLAWSIALVLVGAPWVASSAAFALIFRLAFGEPIPTLERRLSLRRTVALLGLVYGTTKVTLGLLLHHGWGPPALFMGVAALSGVAAWRYHADLREHRAALRSALAAVNDDANAWLDRPQVEALRQAGF